MTRAHSPRVQDAEPPVELVVERLTYGAEALAHHEGRVVFVPYVAPGERVRVRVVERSGAERAVIAHGEDDEAVGIWRIRSD